MNDLLGAGIIAGAIVVVMAVAELLWWKVARPRGWRHEFTRKIHHAGIGLVSSAAPWLISPWTGFALAIGFGAMLVLAYKLGVLASFYNYEPTVADEGVVRRLKHSWVGPACFALAVAILSAWTLTIPSIFTASVLVLAIGDASATAIGMLYGRDHYLIFGTRRSLEGNVALWVVGSLLCAGALSGTGPKGFVVALLFGFLLCLMETISPFGLDNFTLPLTMAAVLRSLWSPGGPVIGWDAVLAFALVGGAAFGLTIAHQRPHWVRPSALVLAGAVVILAALDRWLFVGLLTVFLACTLAADRLAVHQGCADASVGGEVLSQCAPCLAFILAGQVPGWRGVAVGSLACVALLARRMIAARRTAQAERPRTPGVTEEANPDLLTWQRWKGGLVEGAIGFGAAAGATAIGLCAVALGDVGPLGFAWLAVLLAALIGGLSARVWSRRDLESRPHGALVDLIPGMLTVSAIPLLAAVLWRVLG